MKNVIALAIALAMLLTMNATAFATETELQSAQTGLFVDLTTIYVGEENEKVEEGGSAQVGTENGDVTVENAPEGADSVVVIPMEDESLNWVDDKVSGDVLDGFVIHFRDDENNDINAEGSTIQIDEPETNKKLVLVGVSEDGTITEIPYEIVDGKVVFTAEGSDYFVFVERPYTSTFIPDEELSVTIPVRGEENTVHAEATVTGNHARLHEMDAEEINHIVGDHVNTGVVEIDVTGLDAEITRITLPFALLKQIAEAAQEAHNDTAALRIHFKHGTVKLDDKALRAIVNAANGEDVMLVLENVGVTRLNAMQLAALADEHVAAGFEAYLMCVKTGNRIADFEGGVATLSAPFALPKGFEGKDFAVWYIAEDGQTEKLKTWFKNDRLFWDVGHFSDFVVLCNSENAEEFSAIPETGDDHNLKLWTLVLALSLTALGVLIAHKRAADHR